MARLDSSPNISGGLPIASKESPWAITYTPYTERGICKTYTEVRTDVDLIAAKGFKAIRLYSTDCSILWRLAPSARHHSLDLILGIFISEAGVDGAAAQEQLTEIVAFGQWDQVPLIVIGNEPLFYEYCTASELASFIGDAKARLRDAGYMGAVTTVEHPHTIAEHAALLCPHLDVLASSIQPFFNPRYPASAAGSVVTAQLSFLEGACHDGVKRETLVLETGWPSAGDRNEEAIPGRSEQRQAVESIRRAVGHKAVFSSFVDEPWRQPGDFGVEQFWGCLDVFG